MSVIQELDILIEQKYTVYLEKDDDGGYVATIPAIPGAISDGDTIEDALKNIKEAALGILECQSCTKNH